MRKNLFKIFCLIFLLILVPVGVFGDETGGSLTGEEYRGLEILGGATGDVELERGMLNPQQTIGFKIGQIIKMVLQFLGVIALILVIYGGFLWMTAGGNEEQVTKARKYLKNAFIGLIIILTSYLIVFEVLWQIFQAT